MLCSVSTKKKDQQWKATIVIQPRGRVLLNQNLDFTAMQHENDDPIVYADSLHVETLTNLHGLAEELDYIEEVEFGSDTEDGNSDIELTDEEESE